MNRTKTSAVEPGRDLGSGQGPATTGPDDAAIIETLCESIHSQTLAKTCQSLQRHNSKWQSRAIAQLIDGGLKACAAISSDSALQQAHLINALARRDVRADPDPDLSHRDDLQFQNFGLRVDPADVAKALAGAADEGFFAQELPRRNMIDALTRYSSFVDLTRWDDCSTRLRLRWREPGRIGTRLQRLAPTPEDYAFLHLPRPLWPAYACVKPIRKAVERITGRTVADTAGLRSGARNLGTPTMLVPELLALAAPIENDMVVDLGCGDGRIIIEAARRYRCRAIGVEQNPLLAASARENIERAEVSNLASIHHGPAETFDFESATIVFLFLPARSLGHFLRKFLLSPKPERRIIAHEQSRIFPPCPPVQSRPVISERALTVGHLWKM